MTEQPDERHASVWPIWAWIMVLLGLAVTGVGIVGGVFSRSLLLDLVSFWPGLILVMLVAAALYPFHRGQWSRLAAVVPLLVLTWLGSTIALHLAEWSVLPSAAADFDGPPVGAVAAGSMTLSTSGELLVTFETGSSLYAVEMMRRGGSTPPAKSLERVDADVAQVVIGERESAGWFATQGWRLKLARETIWNVDLDAGQVTADLSNGSLSSLRLAGAGDVQLPAPVGQVEVSVEGRFVIQLPADAPMSVIGTNVDVPAGWSTEDGESLSPASGDGYVVTVTEGASLVVRES